MAVNAAQFHFKVNEEERALLLQIRQQVDRTDLSELRRMVRLLVERGVGLEDLQQLLDGERRGHSTSEDEDTKPSTEHVQAWLDAQLTKDRERLRSWLRERLEREAERYMAWLDRRLDERERRLRAEVLARLDAVRHGSTGVSQAAGGVSIRREPMEHRSRSDGMPVPDAASWRGRSEAAGTIQSTGRRRETRGAPRHSRGRKHGPMAFRIGNQVVSGESGREFFIKAWRWLLRNGHVRRDELPIATSTKRYLLALQPVHPNGRHFFQPVELEPGVFLETHMDRNQFVTKLARELDRRGISYQVLVG